MSNIRLSAMSALAAAMLPLISGCQNSSDGGSGLTVQTESYNGKVNRIVLGPKPPELHEPGQSTSPEPDTNEQPTAQPDDKPAEDPKLTKDSTDIPPGDSSLPEVLQPPTLVTAPASTRAMVGDKVTFKIVARGDAVNYRWYKNGKEIKRSTDPTLTIDSVELSDADSYHCGIGNLAGAVKCPSPFNLTVWQAATITQQPQGTTALEGESVVLSVVTDGYPMPQVDWYKDGNKVASNTFKFTINDVTKEDTGSYYCIAKNQAGEAKCNSATVTINEPTKITKNPSNQVVAAGKTVNIDLAATGEAPLTYQCYQDGKLKLEGNTPDALVIENASLEDNGVYSCGVFSANESAATFQAFNLTVMEENSRNVRVNWQPPTSRSNGSPLDKRDISEFVVHVADNIDGPFRPAARANWWESGATVPDLSLNEYYFIGITTKDVEGLESDMSAIIRIKVQ